MDAAPFSRSSRQGSICRWGFVAIDRCDRRDGTLEAAYPPELLSIEAYTKGKLKPGDVLNAENVDIVKDLLDPGAYYQIKHDGRLVDLAPTETDVTRLTPMPFLEATLSNKGKHKIFPDGNFYTLEGKPGLVAIPSRSHKVAQEVLMAQHTQLGQARHPGSRHARLGHRRRRQRRVPVRVLLCRMADGWASDLEPHPYMAGHETQIRFLGGTVVAPADVNGTGILQVWAYDQRQLPGYYVYQPTTKRVRSYPVDQRFEPQFPGNTFFVTEYWRTGDPLLTWGNFKLVGKGPMLAGAHHCADLDQPNWLHKTCGGKSGVKYWRTRMELVPEAYVVELQPVAYPRAPIGKKRIWYDARTLTPLTMISYDRQGKVWKQWEGGFDYYERKPGMTWIEGVPEHFWSWTHVHAHDLQSNRMSRFYYAQTVPGGFHATVDDARLFGDFCSIEALERLGR